MNFHDLPLEIQLLILNNKHILRHTFKINKKYNMALRSDYYDAFICSPITTNELLLYLHTYPLNYFVLNYIDTIDYFVGYAELYTINDEIRPFNYWISRCLGYDSCVNNMLREDVYGRTIEDIINNENKYIRKEQMLEEGEHLNFNKIYDIYTISWIVQKRCGELNHDYVIWWFSMLCKVLDNSISLFLYLYFNARLLHIPTSEMTIYMASDQKIYDLKLIDYYSIELFPKILAKF